MNEQIVSNRYNEADLVEFKAHVEKKLEKAERQLANLEEQLADAAQAKDSQGDWMDDSSNSNDIDMLQMMANRQKKHILDLRNALQRIHNKSYGICMISGELIDKRRLMAVPTTTKSLAAKMGTASPAKKPSRPQPRPSASGPKIISRIISKPKPKVEKPKIWEDNDDLDLELDEDYVSTEVNFDNLSKEDLD